MRTIAILGTVGLPASYGGFETLAENLVRFYRSNNLTDKLVVYCSGKAYKDRPVEYMGAELRYVELEANGISSILYDVVSIFSAAWRGSDVILLLGVSGAVVLPILRLFSRSRIVTNIDGVEWKRGKWGLPARLFLHFSEWLAVHFSHVVICDNKGIADHVLSSYGRQSHVIAYGGDHAVSVPEVSRDGVPHFKRFALALCRIEPENNVEMILRAFAAQSDLPLVFIGNWKNSDFGRKLRSRYKGVSHIELLDPIYDLGVLRSIRGRASVYIHGHSAGGTNPSLVEMMHFGVPILAFDCIYNRYSTENKANYFSDATELRQLVTNLTPTAAEELGKRMKDIAKARYTWNVVGQAYFDLLSGVV